MGILPKMFVPSNYTKNAAAVLVPAVSASLVRFDAKFSYSSCPYGTSNDYGSSGINVGSGSNGTTDLALIILAIFQFGNNAGTDLVLTWDSLGGTPQNVPVVGGPYSNDVVGNMYLCGLVAPHTGQLNLTASWTGNSELQLYALSVVGADQTGGTTTFRAATSNSGNSTSPSVTVSGAAATEMCVAGFEFGDTSRFANDGTPTNIGHWTGAGWFDTAASYSDAGASTTLTHPASGAAQPWIAAGMAIKAA